jgi:NodT family efflux transporter outer membrane factor (OMF) lipoprotein
MMEAFAENLTLAQALARLDQLRAYHSAARATWFPTVRAEASRTEQGELGDPEGDANAALPGGTAATLPEAPRYRAGLTAAYELDIWGKLAAGRAAAHADLLAGEENLRAVALTLAAQIARTYFRVVELGLQRALLERTVSSYEDSHALVLARYQRGVAPSVDVYQAETNLAGARAQQALTHSTLIAAEHALAVLLGRYPQTGLLPEGRTLPGALAPVPPGLPSELVERRPDVRAAYYQLVAADRRAAAAAAERLPSISLTGALSGDDDDLAKALDPDNMVWNAIANLVVPLFEGGRRKANVRRADAVWREQVAAFRAVLLGAYREVEDALAHSRLQREYVTQLEAQAGAAEASLRLATDRYLQGLSDYLPVVVAQASYLAASRGLIAARRGWVDAHVGLATALGGNWMDEKILAQYPGLKLDSGD